MLNTEPNGHIGISIQTKRHKAPNNSMDPMDTLDQGDKLYPMVTFDSGAIGQEFLSTGSNFSTGSNGSIVSIVFNVQ